MSQGQIHIVTAKTCGACNGIKPLLPTIIQDLKTAGFTVFTYDLPTTGSLPSQYGVPDPIARAVTWFPIFIYYSPGGGVQVFNQGRDGKPVDRPQAPTSPNIKEWALQCRNKMSKAPTPAAVPPATGTPVTPQYLATPGCRRGFVGRLV